jgi:Right handed beta helix region/Periplasmic copper-binding protein (NosD)
MQPPTGLEDMLKSHRLAPTSLHCFFLSLGLTCSFSPLLSAQTAEHFFTPPDAPFITRLEEKIHRISLPAGTAEASQTLIDAARKEKPEAILILQPTGNLTIGSTPLRLGSKMCLQLSPFAGLTAGANCSAPSLISVEKAEFVSISSSGPGPATLDGGNQSIHGIKITEGSRINLDQLNILRCAKTGIDYRGTTNVTSLNEAASVTRCHFEKNGTALQVDQSGGFQCLDNVFHDQTGTALIINSLNSMVAGNTFSGNKADIQASSDRGIIARNTFGKSELTLDLTPTSKGNLISENRGTARDLNLTIAGEAHQLFHNTLSGSVKLAPGTKEAFLISNENLQTDQATPGLKFFNPPTLNRPHTNSVIVAGMGRFDLPLIAGGKKEPKPADKDKPPKIIPVDLSLVQAEIAKAQTEHPNDVLVIRLDGEYICKNPNGLELPPNSCLLMAADARILSDLGIPLEPAWARAEPLTQVVLLPKTGFCSISGGKLDANRQAHFPINANTGSIALIESTSLIAGARDGINTKTRKGSDPIFLYRCNVYGNNGRGIWSHVANRVHAIANVCSGNFMDGIDLDAHAINCTALFNVCNANRRHGVFIEEAIENNIVFGNQLDGNGTGIHVWNEEVKGNTGPNLISANHCSGNRRGIGLGGRADDITAHGNLFFNNVCTENREDGILTGNSKAKENYFSQSVAYGNGKENIGVSSSAFFFNTVLPNP